MNTKTIEIRDLYFAAFLLARGCDISRIDRINDRRVVFVFDRIPKLDVLAHTFMCGKSPMVDVRDFVAAVKHIKNIIYDSV